jgi:hypothetical protein
VHYSRPARVPGRISTPPIACPHDPHRLCSACPGPGYWRYGDFCCRRLTHATSACFDGFCCYRSNLAQMARNRLGIMQPTLSGPCTNDSGSLLARNRQRAKYWCNGRNAGLKRRYSVRISETVGRLGAACLSCPHAPAGALGVAGFAPSRQIAMTAAMIAGPTNNPIRPNVSRPPKMPRRTHRKGSRVDAPISAGRTK